MDEEQFANHVRVEVRPGAITTGPNQFAQSPFKPPKFDKGTTAASHFQ